MNKLQKVLTFISFLGLTGCGGTLYTAKPLDSNSGKVVLLEGMKVSVSVTSPDSVLSKKLRNQFRAQLSKKNIEVVDESSNTIVVEIDRYEKGIGLFRFKAKSGFAALGASYLDGTVELSTDNGNTTLNVFKSGQATGTSQTGDQTDNNAKAFVKKVVYKMYKKSK